MTNMNNMNSSSVVITRYGLNYENKTLIIEYSRDSKIFKKQIKLKSNHEKIINVNKVILYIYTKILNWI